MRRPEKNFWIYVAILSSVLLLGLSGQLISCASAHPGMSRGHYHAPEIGHEHIAPWNQPGPAVTSSPGVSINAQLDRGAILQNGDGVVRVEVSLSTANDHDASPRRASDIVVVVDTSGSMSGEKLETSKRALHELIARLDAQDRFGLVEYSDAGRVLVPLEYAQETNKYRFRSIASSLGTNGSTNMSDGLDYAIDMLRQRASTSRPGRVLLLSDGLANAGDSSFEGLTRRARTASANGIAVTTMGVGTDFDENLMTALATSGTGAFYYIAKLEYLPEFFDAELASTRGTYGNSAELRFSMAPGVALLDAMGLPTTRRGNESTILVGNLYSGRARSVWLTLRVPSHTTGSKDLGHLSLSYQRNGGTNTVTVGSLPAVACLTDEEQYYQHIHRSVWERALIDDVFNRTQEEFGDAIRTGDKRQIHGALQRAESERVIANRIGSTAVVSRIDQLKGQAQSAEAAQSAPAAERNRAAKASKARGYQSRNKAVFDEDAQFSKSY